VRCPFCGDEEDRVVDTRSARDGDEIRRRRECAECGSRFTTRERIETVLPRIIKSDERREDFDRRKLLLGIEAACVKRPVSTDALERLIDRIEKELQESGLREIASGDLGERTMKELLELDLLAAVRFASVFRNFDRAEDYEAFFDSLDSSEKSGS
jgi:transcriptional repressor NrdR